jgi:5'-3' exonuclease
MISGTDFLFDGNSLFARAWFSCYKPGVEMVREITLKRAIVSVLNILDVDNFNGKATRLLFCWDMGRKTNKRHAEKPTDYHPTMEELKKLLTALLGVAHSQILGQEADDLVATAAFKSTARNVIVISGDKDLRQLHGGNIQYYCLNAGSLISKRAIVEKMHVKRPSQIAIALAIVGDRSDNIPGIRGWGERKVNRMFQSVTETMSFEEALDTIDAQIPASLKNDFYTSLELTLLHTSVEGVAEPTPIRWMNPENIEDLGLPGLRSIYQKVYTQYNLDEIIDSVTA